MSLSSNSPSRVDARLCRVEKDGDKANELMNSFYQFRNDSQTLESMMWITVVANRLRFSPPLDLIDQTKPFILGRHLKPDSNAVPVAAVRTGTLASFSIQSDGIFADQKISNAILDVFGEAVQSFQVVEVKTGDPQFERIRLVNLTCLVDCVDFVRSDIELWPDDPNRIRSIFGLVLDETKISRGNLLFRLAKAPGVIVASNKGREVLLGTGVSDAF